MHLFPQLWWERHKGHCGWRKGPGNRQRSSYLVKYPHQSPKTDNQAFASGRSWVGITEVFLCCVNLSSTQKELKCERDLRIEENICFKVQKQETKCLPLSLGQLGWRIWGKLVWTCRLLRKSWSASEAKIERVMLQSKTEPLSANNLYFELKIWAGEEFSEPRQIAFSLDHLTPVRWRNPNFKFYSHFTYIRPLITSWYHKTQQNSAYIAIHLKVCRIRCFVEENLLFCSRTKRFSVRKQRRHLRPARFAK